MTVSSNTLLWCLCGVRNHRFNIPPPKVVPVCVCVCVCRGETHVAMGAVIFTALDLVERGITEVELLCAVVDGQAVGCADVIADDHQYVGTRQGGTHDTRGLLIPVSPEHQTGREREREGERERGRGREGEREREREWERGREGEGERKRGMERERERESCLFLVFMYSRGFVCDDEEGFTSLSRHGISTNTLLIFVKTRLTVNSNTQKQYIKHGLILHPRMHCSSASLTSGTRPVRTLWDGRPRTW